MVGQNAGERGFDPGEVDADAGRVELPRLDDDLDLKGVAVDLFALAVIFLQRNGRPRIYPGPGAASSSLTLLAQPLE